MKTLSEQEIVELISLIATPEFQRRMTAVRNLQEMLKELVNDAKGKVAVGPGEPARDGPGPDGTNK